MQHSGATVFTCRITGRRASVFSSLCIFIIVDKSVFVLLLTAFRHPFALFCKSVDAEIECLWSVDCMFTL